MCRCWQSCWEDFYWNCIEEKFCYDETIANYNPDEDEYFHKKTGNGFLAAAKLENNNTPVCNQPGQTHRRQPSNLSNSKIHEDDYRQIQTNAPILAPEIMSVFANSQIFHDHQPIVKKASMPSVHGVRSGGNRENDSEKLLFRLEGDAAVEPSTAKPYNVQFSIEGNESVSDLSTPPNQPFPSIREEDEKGEVILRPQSIPGAAIGSSVNNTPIMNKRLRNVQSVPYFPFRPASENDIFSITGSMGQISMTPEIPSISYSTLPKNYEDTPTIEKYKESVSLYSIQTANSAKISEMDFSMPRYFRKADIIAQSADSLRPIGDGGGGGGGDGAFRISVAAATGSTKNLEKSKRLKMLRTNLPPLAIHLGGGSRERAKGIE